MNMLEVIMQNATAYSNMPPAPIPQPLPAISAEPINEQDEQAFYTMVSKEVRSAVECFEERLNSVHKERESVI